MPYYTLWRAADDKTYDSISARDNAHAVAIYSEKLGIPFTLEEGPTVATYMMARKERRDPAEATWAKPPDIPVWVEDTEPPN